jgi:hypothetical protein
VLDVNGSLYGTAMFGGKHDDGVFFHLTHSGSIWTYKVVHSFGSGSEGYSTTGGLTYAARHSGALWNDTASLYGVTSGGSAFAMTCCWPRSNPKPTL